MTDKQINLARKQLPPRTQIPWREWTEEQKLIDRELSCREMINSILAYNCEGYKDAQLVLEYEERSYHNYLEDYTKELGRDRVVELIQDQINSIDYVKRNVFTDNEGLSYNSIVWIDEY